MSWCSNNTTLPPQLELTFPTASGLSLLVVDHANLSENPKLPKAFPKLTMKVRALLNLLKTNFLKFQASKLGTLIFIGKVEFLCHFNEVSFEFFRVDTSMTWPHRSPSWCFQRPQTHASTSFPWYHNLTLAHFLKKSQPRDKEQQNPKAEKDKVRYIKCSLNIASIHLSTRKKVRFPANTADKERLEGIATGIGVLTPADILLGP